MTEHAVTGERVRSQPLVQSVEDLSAEGYVVLTAAQAEQVTVILGELAFPNPAHEQLDLCNLAEDVLAEWPSWTR